MHWPWYHQPPVRQAEDNDCLDATSNVMVNTQKSVNASGVTSRSMSCGPDTTDKPAMTTTCRMRSSPSKKDTPGAQRGFEFGCWGTGSEPQTMHDPSRKPVAVLLQEERSKSRHTKKEKHHQEEPIQDCVPSTVDLAKTQNRKEDKIHQEPVSKFAQLRRDWVRVTSRVGELPLVPLGHIQQTRLLAHGHSRRVAEVVSALVRNCPDTQICCQSCRKGMTSQGGRRCHRRHHLNVLKLDELEVVVVEAIVHYHLGQEHHDLWNVVLVGWWQIDILHVEDQSSPFLRAVDAPTCASVIEQNWRNFWSTSFDDVRALQCSTATLNVQVKLILQPADGVPGQEILPATLGPLTMMGCYQQAHVLKRSIFWSTQPACTRGGRTKDRFTASNVTLVPPMPSS